MVGVHIAGKDLNEWEAESAYHFLEVWEAIDQNLQRYLVDLLNNPNDISKALKAREYFEDLLPEHHQRLSQFFLTSENESREKVAAVLQKLLLAKKTDFDVSDKRGAQQVTFSIYNRATKPLTDWYKKHTDNDAKRSRSPTSETRLDRVDQEHSPGYRPSRSRSATPESPNSAQKRGEEKGVAEEAEIEEGGIGVGDISISEKGKPKAAPEGGRVRKRKKKRPV